VKSSEPFTWPVRVYYEDSDAQGLVYFANYFKFMERARTEWLRALGIEQDVLLREKRRFFVVVDCQAEFLAPARFNDQLVVTASLTGRRGPVFRLSRRSFAIDGTASCCAGARRGLHS
jgi:acyl-CoA thioester hydrolase